MINTSGVCGRWSFANSLLPAADEERSAANSEQTENGGFRHGLKGQSIRTRQTRGKDALRSVRREFINGAGS